MKGRLISTKGFVAPVDYMSPGEIDHRKIERDVRGAVREINALPFVKTISSCEGHITKLLFDSYRPDPDHAFMWGGHLGMEVDCEREISGKFLSDVLDLTKKYPFSGMGHATSFGDASTYILSFNSHYIMGMDFDLGHPELVKDSYSEEIKWRVGTQVDMQSAKRRKTEYKNFWKDLEEVARKYSESK